LPPHLSPSIQTASPAAACGIVTDGPPRLLPSIMCIVTLSSVTSRTPALTMRWNEDRKRSHHRCKGRRSAERI
jgi:hypothetical protein